MKKSFKVLLVMLLALSLGCFVAACSNDEAPQDEQNITDDNPNAEDQQNISSSSIEEMTDMANVKEINIYLNGVKNTISLEDSVSTLLVEGLGDTLAAAQPQLR